METLKAQNSIYDVIVIGAGASGLLAAREAASRGADCLLLEGLDMPGKKLLATGNGRCNMGNMQMSPSYFRSRHPRFTEAILSNWSPKALRQYWAELGLATREEEGRVYPYSFRAESLHEVLVQSLRSVPCTLRCGQEVQALRAKKALSLDREAGAIYHVGTKDGQVYRGRAVILATGGRAAPKLGGLGTGYALYEGLGHRLVPQRPALVQLCSRQVPRRFAGLRCRVELRLEAGRKAYVREAGELLFTDYGLSGICVLNLSALVAEQLEQGREPRLFIDFLPDLDEDQALSYVQGLRRSQGFRDAGLWGLSFLPAKISRFLYEERYQDLVRALGLSPRQLRRQQEYSLADIGDDFVRRLIQLAKAWPCQIQGTRGFDFAQVTDGGLDTRQFNPYTLQSLLWPGLYACGEVLDVCGVCGGYNLHWAFASGIEAGRSAALLLHQEGRQTPLI